eukprot:2963848-Karenia_brevis.AAC.1
MDMLGRRRVVNDHDPWISKAIKQHVGRITSAYRTTLKRKISSNTFRTWCLAESSSPYFKPKLLVKRLMLHGPPLPLALSWAGPPAHQSAISSLFCGDL